MWAGEVKALVSIRNTKQQATRHEILEGEHAVSGDGEGDVLQRADRASVPNR